ncbi:class E sortase [Rubrobacter naiadicus]|uniref:class E sortase n=1 Tax=Rubrobacter naiadicus TaxID=1392641 RepID=UPI002360213C|nr:class E sortase [Rubrobacter naiadicus]
MFQALKRKARSRIRTLLSLVVSLVMVAAGLALIGFFFLGSRTTDTNGANPGGFNIPRVEPSQGGRVPKIARVPKNDTLRLTIPAMSRVKDAVVPTVPSDDVKALNNHVAIHLKGTGFPWQKTANVYIAGHRLGYVGTKSLLAFYDLGSLKKGDRIYLTDSSGTRYTYRVYREFTVSPTDLGVTRAIPGRNIVTLQTCTLPDYSHRLIVRGKLVSVKEGAGSTS